MMAKISSLWWKLRRFGITWSKFSILSVVLPFPMNVRVLLSQSLRYSK
jgi:hypothetical protein